MSWWTLFLVVLGVGSVSLGWGSDGQDEAGLKVMTFNIRYGTAQDGENSWPNRKEMVFEMIRKHQPDILGLQEALDFQIDEIVAAVPGYKVFGIGRDDAVRQGEFSPVLYRADKLGILEAGTKWISEAPDVIGSKGPGANIPRIFTWVKFQERGRKPFLVMNAHFDHQSPAARLMGATQMVEFAKRFGGLATVMMGDFNCGFEDAPVKHVLASGYSAARPETGPYGTFTGFKIGAVDGSMIDHVFFDSRWTLVSAEIDRWSTDGRYPSDHFPVVAVLRMTP